MFSSSLKELQQDVSNNQDIQDYFNLFGVDINKVLVNNGEGPDVYISENIGDGRYGTYKDDFWFNDVLLSKNIYEQKNSQQILQETLIHEIAHYADDVGSWFGYKSPDLGRFSWVGDKVIDEHYNFWDGPYGYGAEFILYPEKK